MVVLWNRFPAEMVIFTASRKKCIGVGRFRILGGGQGLEYWGAKFPAGTSRRYDVDAT